jgi:hypothetical protein
VLDYYPVFLSNNRGVDKDVEHNCSSRFRRGFGRECVRGLSEQAEAASEVAVGESGYAEREVSEVKG